ncbi:sensor histidine kinase [Roseateles violae]|uniref:Histidine kinase n=1 Tax=Roseateles violae TaxID=3058042 RepID=A0ABT8DQA2_9BURK|nr:histidine kinase [Pelomonas sp. PFR6]MDN3920529.1 histidine kinase [Pelomonas sp. PFR6]
MSIWHSFRKAWRAHWRLNPQRSEPLALQGAVTLASGLLVGLALALGAGLQNHNLFSAVWLHTVAPANTLLGQAVAVCFHLAYRLIEAALPAAQVEKMAAWRDWRAALLHGGIAMVCVSAGAVSGLLLVDRIWQMNAWSQVLGDGRAVLQFLLISLLVSGLQWLWWRMRWRQQDLQLRATEAQLKLLQAQIEPHFLFNTLANVQSLIDYDTPRAKQMLEAFTDYLRASLGQLRVEDSSLGAELAMAESYLQLLQTRMGERLRFVIEADAAARAAVLPPLLLQPLIENAIHHGLEPKLEGGRVQLRATVEAGRLQVCIDDDGLGLAAPRRAGRRPGSGLALENIRARLATRYAEQASLHLEALQPSGTRALLKIPYATAQAS